MPLYPQTDGMNVLIQPVNKDVVGVTQTPWTLAKETQLQFPVEAGGQYMMEGLFHMSGDNAAADADIGIVVLDRAHATQIGQSMDIRTVWNTINAAGAVSNTLAQGAAVNQILQIPGIQGIAADIGQATPCWMEGSFRANTQSILIITVGNSIATGGATSRMWAGSYLKYKRIA